MGRGGTPNRAEAESEHTVVRGSNRGRNITSMVVHHEQGQPDLTAMAALEHSPKEDPPDRGGSFVNEFNFPNVAMEEDLGLDRPVEEVAGGHMRS
nr:uncharacterized protein LOC109179535 isoform X2 [Ipomoea trifida]